MYKEYEVEALTRKVEYVKYSTYYNIFKGFNLSFHKPKKDQCKKCMQYQSLNDTEKTEALKAEYDAHREKALQARREKNLE